MVFPETPDPHDGNSGRSLRLLGTLGALILIVSAVFILGRLTTPPPPSAEPEPSTTSTTILRAPTTTSPFPEQGVPFQWLQVVELEHPPIAVHDMDGRTLVYGHGTFGQGVELWSSDPRYWGLTVIDSDHYVQSFIETWFGLLAVGSEVESGAPVVWRSTDGITWDKTALPTDGIDNLQLSHIAAQASNDLITVHGQMRAGDNHDSLYRQAEGVMKERFGDLLEFFYWEVAGPEVRFNAFGPFGLVLGWSTAQQLGLDASEYTNGDDPEIAVIWASHDGTDWSTHVLDLPLYLGETFIGPSGGLWALGQNGFLTTTDGVHWKRIPTTRTVNRPISWGNTIVAFSWNIGHIVISSDGSNWETIDGPDRRFVPAQGDTPERYTMAAGPYGLAILITRPSEDPITAPLLRSSSSGKEPWNCGSRTSCSSFVAKAKSSYLWNRGLRTLSPAS